MSTAAAGTQLPLAALAELVRRALDATGAPIGWISFIEDGRERLHARIGVTFTELDASHSPLLCAGSAAPLMLADASQGAWRQHPLVAAGPRARFMAVVPLLDAGANVMGALTVLDPRPRDLRRTQGTALLNLASLAVARVAAMRSTQAPAAAVQGPLEDELSVERSLARALGEQIDGGFFVAGHDGVLLRWNAAFSRSLGV
ncbi:MAG TPA: GAF domain-containing protein, partial [Usitatibacter sp.]|nr:GAF domain-containing protein [Usitatibacter sp.]